MGREKVARNPSRYVHARGTPDNQIQKCVDLNFSFAGLTYFVPVATSILYQHLRTVFPNCVSFLLLNFFHYQEGFHSHAMLFQCKCKRKDCLLSKLPFLRMYIFHSDNRPKLSYVFSILENTITYLLVYPSICIRVAPAPSAPPAPLSLDVVLGRRRLWLNKDQHPVCPKLGKCTPCLATGGSQERQL